MQKVNSNEVPELHWSSPKGKFGGYGKQISEALGRDPASTDALVRHPFDIEIARLEPGQTPYPYHSHSAQWEFYHIISGTGKVRDESGITPVQRRCRRSGLLRGCRQSERRVVPLSGQRQVYRSITRAALATQ